MANPNPNEPNFPYGGGTDNPGDNTAIAGGPTDVQATETAPLQVGAGGPSLAGETAVRFPPIVAGLAQQGTDTPLAPGQVVPSAAAGFESTIDPSLRAEDPSGGVQYDPISGEERESGQDEVAGETETTSGISPSQFPEPNP